MTSEFGFLVDRHCMVWQRIFPVGIEKVWPFLSTIEGLSKWWMGGVAPKKLELKIGGLFEHHWTNTLVEFEPLHFLDFAENTGMYAGTGGMRFELKATSEHATHFQFLDTWGPDGMPPVNGDPGAFQPGGPGTPWAGVAAGWHGMINALGNQFSDQPISISEDTLVEYYADYLRDWYRLHDMVQRQQPH